jgi:hypothetical protein
MEQSATENSQSNLAATADADHVDDFPAAFNLNN